MDNFKIKEVTPKYVAQVCPNCNGRGTVGYDRKPCPTCGHTNMKGVILIPNGGTDEYMDKNL